MWVNGVAYINQWQTELHLAAFALMGTFLMHLGHVAPCVQIGVLPGPNAAPDYFTEEDISTFYSSSYSVHYNSCAPFLELFCVFCLAPSSFRAASAHVVSEGKRYSMYNRSEGDAVASCHTTLTAR